MAVNVSPWASTGNRGFLNINTLDPQQLFNAHKNRVVADGGVILNEASLLDEINFLVNNGMWKYVTFYASPEWGIKYAADGTSVIKMYGLGLTDFTATDVGGANLRPVTLDSSVSPPALSIRVQAGGSYMRADNLVIAQYSANNPFLFSSIMRDTESSDVMGISIVACRITHSNNMASMAVERSVPKGTDYGFRHFAAINYPVNTVADWLIYGRTPYAANIKNAALISPATGTLFSYESGELKSTLTAPGGHLVDQSVIALQMNLGMPDNAVGSVTWKQGALTNGSVSRLRCLSYATPAQAALISKRG
ncbi:hypothetical protein HL670_03904 [Serratia plymuthica]|uniref:hypothetical protein n=1 Tax=Serratia plymuthica TaxID=82996 RepID=UPI0003485556|nr:hypothetical protein [Serratia plymuthica]QJW57007.1 hypothetical protein HL670_03904 [Serratia plymuthica]